MSREQRVSGDCGGKEENIKARTVIDSYRKDDPIAKTILERSLPILWPAFASTTINFSLRLQASMSDSFSGFLLEMTYDTNTLPFVLLLTRRWRPFIMVLWLSFPYLLYSQAIVAIIFLQKIASWLGEPLGIPA